MKRNLKIASAVAIAVCAFSGLNVTTASAQNITEVLRRVDKRNQILQTLQADVTMEKVNTQLKETDTQTGKIKYIPKTAKMAKNKMYVRLDWNSPRKESMSVIGDQYEVYLEQQKTVYQGRTSDAKSKAKAGSALSLISMSRADLTANFTHRVLGTETIPGGIETINVEMTPKTSAAYKLAHVFIDSNGMPRMIRIFEKDGITITTILLSDPVENASINGADFKLVYPASIKPIR
jgi:hypothetical protein